MAPNGNPPGVQRWPYPFVAPGPVVQPTPESERGEPWRRPHLVSSLGRPLPPAQAPDRPSWMNPRLSPFTRTPVASPTPAAVLPPPGPPPPVVKPPMTTTPLIIGVPAPDLRPPQPSDSPTPDIVPQDHSEIVTRWVTVLAPATPTTSFASDIGLFHVHPCATADYTLFDVGRTVYHAPFVGCVAGSEDCCPFVTKPVGEPGGALTSQTLGWSGNTSAGACVGGYTPIASQCCPSHYTPWTALLGDQTPCFSSIFASVTPSPGTGVLDTLDPSKTTITVTDIVFAMSFPLGDQEDNSKLSPGVIAGIVVGIAAGILGLIGLAAFIRRHRKKARRLTDLKRELRSSYYQGTSEVPTARTNGESLGIRSQKSLGTMNLRQDSPRSDQSGLLKATSSSYRYTPSNTADSFSSPTGDRDNPFSRPSSPSSPVHEIYGVDEVQVARPQRLSRGYARIVHTHMHGSGASPPVEEELPGSQPDTHRRYNGYDMRRRMTQ